MNNTEQNILKEKARDNIKAIIKDFLKDKRGLEKLSKEISWLYNTPDDLIEIVFNSGYKLAQKETAEKVEKLKEEAEQSIRTTGFNGVHIKTILKIFKEKTE